MSDTERNNLSIVLLKAAYGKNVVLGTDAQFFGVWPSGQTTGPRATAVMVHPSALTFFSVNEIATSDGGILDPDHSYRFPLHPEAHTLSFAAATSTLALHLTWLVTR